MRGKLLILSVLVLLAGQAHVSGQESNVEGMTVYEILQDRMDNYNRFVEKSGFPEQFSFLTSARVNLYVDSETIGVVLEGGKIVEVVKGGIADPTNEFKTSRKYFNSILISENPMKRVNFGLKNAFIVRRDHGMGGISKGKLLERAINKFDVPEPKVERKVSKALNEIAEKREDKFVVEGERAGLRKTDLELKTAEDIRAKMVKIEEYTGYINEAPPGTKILTTKQGEGSLGTYVKIEVPEVKTDEVVLKIAYTDEELDYKFLDEGSLAIKWLDESSGQWRELKAGSPDWVKEIGVNKEENFVFARLAHASVYGVSGSIIDVKKIEEMRGIQPVYFESPEEIQMIREGAMRRGIIDRIIDFILGLFFK